MKLLRRSVPAALVSVLASAFVVVGAEAGDEGAMRRAPGVEGIGHRGFEARAFVPQPRDHGIELDRLLARAAVDVAQEVDRRGHGVVERQPAGHRHARRGDRGRLRAVVDGRHQSRLEQPRLALVRHTAHDQQPDHLGKADVAEQLLHRMAAEGDAARFHVDDRGAPPVGDVVRGVRPSAHITPSSRSAASSASDRPSAP